MSKDAARLAREAAKLSTQVKAAADAAKAGKLREVARINREIKGGR